MAFPDNGAENPAWLKPTVEEGALQRYVQTLRERKWLIIGTTVVATLLAIVYVLTATKMYSAEADLLVTPISGSDSGLSGLGLIQSSSDPTRDVETASKLVTTLNVARRVKVATGDPRSPQKLLEAISVAPVAQSNIVAITAEESSPNGARKLANAFAVAAVAERTASFHRALNAAVKDLQSRVGTNPSPSQTADPTSLASQLARLQTLGGAPDPTMRVESLADLPTSPVSPKVKLSIIAGIIVGLVLGIGAAFTLRVLDPRLRREDQLRTMYGLPVLARIPKDQRAHTSGALAPEQLAPATIEAYRTLRATLSASRRPGSTSQAILVTSPSPSEGKSTTAINLASSLALAGNRVILIEADLRRPAVGEALGLPAPRHGTGDVLLDTVDIEDALVTTSAYGSYLQLLLAENTGGASGFVADRLFLPAAQSLVDDAKRLADYVIVDSPPLSEVIDALPLAQRVDEVLVVVRLGKSDLTKLTQLTELLARHAIRPAGFAVVGVPAPTGEGYYIAPRDPGSHPRERQPARETTA